MKNHSSTVLVAVLVAVATFLVTTALMPREAAAPTAGKNPSGSVIIPLNIVSIREMASTSATVSIEYPQFPGLSADFNDAIASATMSRLAQFRQDAADTAAARAATEAGYSFLASWQPVQINSRHVSFIERFDSYSGGANGSQDIQTFNYDISSQKMLALGDLFPAVPDYLQKISAIARQQLTRSLGDASGGNTPTDMIDTGTEPTAENFSDFTFTDYVVTIYFPKYAVAPGSFGEQQAVISRNEVK